MSSKNTVIRAVFNMFTTMYNQISNVKLVFYITNMPKSPYEQYQFLKGTPIF